MQLPYLGVTVGGKSIFQDPHSNQVGVVLRYAATDRPEDERGLVGDFDRGATSYRKLHT